jgi:hypothetical protein
MVNIGIDSIIDGSNTDKLKELAAGKLVVTN